MKPNKHQPSSQSKQETNEGSNQARSGGQLSAKTVLLLVASAIFAVILVRAQPSAEAVTTGPKELLTRIVVSFILLGGAFCLLSGQTGCGLTGLSHTSLG